MNRYHKSIIGLMEQNKDGEWVRYLDHAREQEKQFEHACSVYRTLERLQESSLTSRELAEKRYKQLHREVTIAKGLIIYGLLIHITSLILGY